MRLMLRLTLREAALGTQRQVIVRALRRCTGCDGVGARPGSHVTGCAVCRGEGQVARFASGSLGMDGALSLQTAEELPDATCLRVPDGIAPWSLRWMHLHASQLGKVSSLYAASDAADAVQGVCPECGGSGAHVEEFCDMCGGDGRSPQDARLTVSVPAGLYATVLEAELTTSLAPYTDFQHPHFGISKVACHSATQ